MEEYMCCRNGWQKQPLLEKETIQQRWNVLLRFRRQRKVSGLSIVRKIYTFIKRFEMKNNELLDGKKYVTIYL